MIARQTDRQTSKRSINPIHPTRTKATATKATTNDKAQKAAQFPFHCPSIPNHVIKNPTPLPYPADSQTDSKGNQTKPRTAFPGLACPLPCHSFRPLPSQTNQRPTEQPTIEQTTTLLNDTSMRERTPDFFAPSFQTHNNLPWKATLN
jgi:hypothetical protein